MPTPQVSALSRRILGDVGCRGFCSVEYKRDPRTGNFYIIEPTVGRVDLQLGVAIANGVDIVSRAYFHLIRRPLAVTATVKAIGMPSDMYVSGDNMNGVTGVVAGIIVPSTYEPASSGS